MIKKIDECSIIVLLYINARCIWILGIALDEQWTLNEYWNSIGLSQWCAFAALTFLLVIHIISFFKK